jgi:hypothetical protein
MAVLDFAQFGSSLALRGFMKVGESMSVAGHGRFEALTIASATMQTTSVEIGAAKLTAEMDAAQRTLFAIRVKGSASSLDKGTRPSLVVTSGGGRLHGQWVADEAVMMSDRRLKRDVAPLETAGSIAALRPVSFRWSAGSAERRYGFLADELGSVLPALVRTLEDGRQGIVYQDLIAVTVAELQAQQAEARATLRRVESMESQASSFKSAIAALEAKVSVLERATAAQQLAQKYHF